MKSKINKVMKIGAAALFVFALALNVNMLLDDPFVYMSDTALATGSDSGGSDSVKLLKFVKLELTSETVVTDFKSRWNIASLSFTYTTTTWVYDCMAHTTDDTCNKANIGKNLQIPPVSTYNRKRLQIPTIPLNSGG